VRWSRGRRAETPCGCCVVSSMVVASASNDVMQFIVLCGVMFGVL